MIVFCLAETGWYAASFTMVQHHPLLGDVHPVNVPPSPSPSSTVLYCFVLEFCKKKIKGNITDLNKSTHGRYKTIQYSSTVQYRTATEDTQL